MFPYLTLRMSGRGMLNQLILGYIHSLISVYFANNHWLYVLIYLNKF